MFAGCEPNAFSPAVSLQREEEEGDIHDARLANLRRSLTVDLEEKDTGDKIVNSVWLSVSINSVILMNTLQMGFEADYPEWVGIWTVFENIFTACFATEMAIKLVVLKRRYFNESANVLDGIITVLGMVDCWLLRIIGSGGADLQSLSVLRILRLMRLARLMKLIRSFKPFVLVIRGVIRAMSTSFYIVLMLLFILYVFGIFFTEHLGHGDTSLYPGFSLDEEVINQQDVFANYNPQLCWGSMLLSMLTLFNMAIMAEWSEIIRPIAVKQPQYVFVFICFAMLVAFGVMNVMIGMIVDSVVDESKRIDVDIERKIKNEKMQTLGKIEDILTEMDENNDDTIDMDEFKQAMECHPHFNELLRNIDVPAGWSADEFMAMLDNSGDGSLQKSEFTTSFFRLLDSDDFQQLCILQASANQTKFMVSQVLASLGDVNCKLSTIEADISCLKNVRHHAVEEKVSEAVGEPCSKLCKQQCASVDGEQIKEAACNSADVLAGCTAGICTELKERIENLSHKHLAETLEAAYSVMNESFQKELAIMQPGVETKLRASAPECKELPPPSELASAKPGLDLKRRACAPEKLSKASMGEETKIKDYQDHLNAAPRRTDGVDENDCNKIRDGHTHVDGHVVSTGRAERAKAGVSAADTGSRVDSPDASDDWQSAGSIDKADACTPDKGRNHYAISAAYTPDRGAVQSETSRNIDSVIALVQQHAHSDGEHAGRTEAIGTPDVRLPDVTLESIASVSEILAGSSVQTVSTDLPYGDATPASGMLQSEASLSIDSAAAQDQQSHPVVCALDFEQAAHTEEATDVPDPKMEHNSSPSGLHGAEPSEQTAFAGLPCDEIAQHAHPAADLEFTFERDIAQLGFEVQWAADQLPIVGRVWPDGAAHVRGVRSGDHLLACNRIPVAGKGREEVIHLLKLRPLLLRMQRSEP